MNLRTAAYDWHASHGGRMVDFAGWDMPVQYSTITKEHQAVRTAAGLFDIAHMGRLKFSGPDAARWLDHLVTNDVTRLQPGDVRYALVTNEAGGILDDVLVYRFPTDYMLVVNACNRAKIVDWIKARQAGFNARMDDQTENTFMYAVQGPRAVEVLQPHTDANLGGMKYYSGLKSTIFGQPAIISRTGYTGDDGFELIVANEFGMQAWMQTLAAGAAQGLMASGLGARDTLRLEAAMPLYGHELSENVDPLTAGLAFGVKLDAGDFIGKQALLAIRQAGLKQRRVGLILDGKRIAREHAAILVGDKPVGEVTSGTFSPTLQQSIAMGYLPVEHAQIGSKIAVDIRGKSEAATIVKLPFYSRRP